MERNDRLALFSRYQEKLSARASSLLLSLEKRLDRFMQLWLLVCGLACAARIAFNPLHGAAGFATVVPYLLLVLAPFVSMVLALRWFQNSDRMVQPKSRLARVRRWRQVDHEMARLHPLYGAGGIMVSLMIGVLLNVPVRALEFLTAMPALAGPIPSWLSTLSFLMTLDVVIFSSLYTVTFVAALKRVPLFPRLLATVWICDVTMQALIWKIVSQVPELPDAVSAGLQALLEGNMQKVGISAAVWLPYLLISQRVNVTYRHRVLAPSSRADSV